MEAFCIVWTLAVFLAVGAWFLNGIRQSPYTPTQTLLYFVNVAFTRLLWRAELPDNLPLGRDEGAVIIANHRSSVDPLFIQVTAQRQVHWLVAAEFAKIKFIDWLYRFTGAIPTSRSGRDTKATKTAIRITQNGGLVGMFPEGTINTTDDLMLKVRPGAIMVAIKAGVPVLPCYLHGSPYSENVLAPLFMTARTKLSIGEPISMQPYQSADDEKGALRAATLKCVKAIADLAGQPEFEPEMAGRRWLEREASNDE